MEVFPEESIAERRDKINRRISLRISMKDIRFVHKEGRDFKPLDFTGVRWHKTIFSKDLEGTWMS